MIGHYLGTLTVEQEDRLLLRSFRPGTFWRADIQCACLVGTVHESDLATFNRFSQREDKESSRGRRIAYDEYERLCHRFGAPRVNAAIRNRILSNRAAHVLGNAVLVGSGETPQL